jgi:hypothetical protein
VQFDHRHHVQDDLIDCRYCHTSARAPYRPLRLWNRPPRRGRPRSRSSRPTAESPDRGYRAPPRQGSASH